MLRPGCLTFTSSAIGDDKREPVRVEKFPARMRKSVTEKKIKRKRSREKGPYRGCSRMASSRASPRPNLVARLPVVGLGRLRPSCRTSSPWSLTGGILSSPRPAAASSCRSSPDDALARIGPASPCAPRHRHQLFPSFFFFFLSSPAAPSSRARSALCNRDGTRGGLALKDRDASFGRAASSSGAAGRFSARGRASFSS